MRLELKIRDLEIPSKSKLDVLSAFLIDFYSKNIISSEQLKYRFDIFYQFKTKFLTKYPSKLSYLEIDKIKFKIKKKNLINKTKAANVNIYGSVAYGICSNDSSCDIDINFGKNNANKSNLNILNDVKEFIKTEMSDVFDSSQFNRSNSNQNSKNANQANFTNNLNKITFETKKPRVAFNFTSGLYSTAYKTSILIKAYLELDDRAKILAFCFRHIAKVNNFLNFKTLYQKTQK